MTVIYFDRRDQRAAMRDPWNPERHHAICRRLLGVARQYPSPFYGAHYYACCALMTDPDLGHRESEQLAYWKRSFAREMNGCDSDVVPTRFRGLWELAVRRVRAIRDEAVALGSSMEW